MSGVEAAVRRCAFRPVGTPVGAFSEVFVVDVAVTSEAGSIGRGRARCITRQEADAVERGIRSFGSAIFGTRVESLEGWWQHWRRFSARCREGWRVLALSAIDLAMWNLFTPPVGENAMPYRTGLFLNASPEELQAEASAAIVRGFAGVKMLLGAPSIDEDVRRVHAVRDAVGGHAVALEAAGRLTAERAEGFLDVLVEADIAWIEDPFPPNEWRQTRQLQAATPVRVGGGETCWTLAGLRAYLERTALQHPILDLGRLGGLTPAVEFIRTDARAYETIGIHVDPAAALALLPYATEVHVWLEFLDWWDDESDERTLLRATRDHRSEPGRTT